MRIIHRPLYIPFQFACPKLLSTPAYAKGFLDPSQFGVLFGKLRRKLFDRVSSKDQRRNTVVARRAQRTAHPLVTGLDASLWQESLAFRDGLHERARALTAQHGRKIGGAGHYELLYFLTRFLKPKVTVETGVAKGFSTQAVLKALSENGTGHLYSSEFPNPRESEEERATAIMVEDDLKDRWTLYVKGDAENLPLILRAVERIDLLHYDSDKRYTGRAFAMDLVRDAMGDGSVLVMDDIDDDLYFHDYVQRADRPWRVLRVEGDYTGTKYVGVVGLQARRLIMNFLSAIDRALARSPAHLWSRWRSRHALAVLAYHAVEDGARFAAQMDYVSTHFRPVSEGDVLRAFRDRTALPERALLVTFDDGHRSVLETALPVLQERRIPAAVYVIAGLLDTDNPFWWDEVEALVRQGGRTTLAPEPMAPLDMVRALKRVPNVQRLDAIRQLRDTAAVSAPRMPQLCRSELPTLEAAGITVGNHTLTHPCLHQCDKATIRHELEASQKILTDALGHAPRTLAYPNGDHDPNVRQMAEDIGFEAAFLFDHRLSANRAS